MKLRNTFIIATLSILINLYTYHNTLSSNENLEDTQNFRVFIQMNRFTFYSDENVELNIHIKNNSYRNVKLKIYDELYTTFQPIVYDMYGREAENIVPYRLKNNKISDLLKLKEPRSITLSPDETFIHSINLKEIYKLGVNREYRVKGFFFPDANISKAISGENILTFKVIDTIKSVKKSGIERIKHEISPSEIVLLFLSSEKDENWKNHLKYIKIGSFVDSFPDFAKIYNNAKDIEKLKIEEDFIKFLSRDRKDYILDFSILTESILSDRNIAYVEAMVKRFGVRIPFIYKYKYTLEKFRDFWLITDVEATVMKGGKK